MAQMKRNGFKMLLCFWAGIIAGFILGIAAMSILVSYRLDQCYEKIAYLENTIKDKDAKLEKLEKSINNRNIVLKDIETILIFEGDEIDKIEIEKAIKEKYSSLLGKEVKSIDGDMVAQVADNRIIFLEDGQYKLKVQRLILTETMKIWILVEPMEE